MLKRLICRLIGHAQDWQADQCGYNVCLRCGATTEAYDPCWPDDTGFYLACCNIRGCPGYYRRRLMEWFNCPDCKGRFGRHDPDRCLPF